MNIPFYKYQGTGNDFILIDNRELRLPHSTHELFESWCHRRFGIGADGLILLEDEEGFDFRMVYFNSDGRVSSMCGNGGRCIVQFAFDLGMIKEETRFIAIDGPHDAVIKQGIVELKMQDVQGIEQIEGDFFLQTGSPHYVRFKKDSLNTFDLVAEAQAIRYNDRFRELGTNVNLVFDAGKQLDVRTYERGVEDETLSCGTGVTAVAIVNHICSAPGQHYTQKIQTAGGLLQLRLFKVNDQKFTDIWLCGPAQFVYRGELSEL